MRRRSNMGWWAGVSLLLAVAPLASGAIEAIPGPWPEGTSLKSVDGSMVRADSNDLWCFEVAQDVNDTRPPIPKGTRLAMLPSATLGRLVADVNDRQAPRYRLSAQVTQYRGMNFLWTVYFLPLSKLKDANEPTPTENAADANAVTIDPNAMAVDRMDSEEMTIPDEIRERLRDRRASRGPQRPVTSAPGTARLGPKPSTRVLVDVVGFLERRGKATVFVPNALGRNVAETQYILLPCLARERAERQVAAWPELVRVKVAGVVTEYQGHQYVLLQRMIRVYDYGNFGG